MERKEKPERQSKIEELSERYLRSLLQKYKLEQELMRQIEINIKEKEEFSINIEELMERKTFAKSKNCV